MSPSIFLFSFHLVSVSALKNDSIQCVSSVVALCCLFLVSEFRLLSVCIIFSSVRDAGWPSFGKELLTHLIIYLFVF